MLIIDPHGSSPSIEHVNSFRGELISVNENEANAELRFKLLGDELAVVFHFNEDGTMWIGPLEGDRRLFPTGRNITFHRIDGPGRNAEMDAMQAIFQNQQPFERSVFLPHEFTVNEYRSLVIRKNGIIEFGGNVFVSRIVDEITPSDNEITLTTHVKNNLLGVDITYLDRIANRHMHIFNIASREKIAIPFDADAFATFQGFFSMGNRFILLTYESMAVHDDATGEFLRDTLGRLIRLETGKVYAFDDATGELLWTQAYSYRFGMGRVFTADIENQLVLATAEKAYAFNVLTGELLWTQAHSRRPGSRIIASSHYLTIDDTNGFTYRIFGDGRKVRFGDRR